MWKEYAVPGGTFRENLLSKPGQPTLPADHPGVRFKWMAPKAEGVAEAADSPAAEKPVLVTTT